MHRTLVTLCAATCACADVLNVPGDYPTIQDAISAASDGDEILVASGTYNEAINLLGKEVHLHSADGPDVTTLDGAGLGDTIIRAENGETFDTVIEGFSIVNGDGTADASSCVGAPTHAGAVHVRNGASITFIGCRFLNNGHNDGLGSGGAIAAFNAGLRILDCEFVDNGGFDVDDDLNTAFGGAVYMCNPVFPGSLIIDGCLFESNGTSAHGGAVWVDADANVSITGSQFFENSASHGGAINCRAAPAPFETLIEGCMFVGCFSSFGGGINLHGDAATVRDCEFIENAAGFGGGLLVNGSSGDFVLDRLRFEGNLAADVLNVGTFHEPCWVDGNQGDYRGGGADLRVSSGTIRLTNSLAVGNQAAFGGGFAANICGGGEITMSNITVAGNLPSGVHARLGEEPGFPAANAMSLSNAILWDNGAADEDQLIVEFALGDDLEFALDHSIVQGGFEGVAVIDADPLFVEGHSIGAGSPAIDAGNNVALTEGLALDLAGNPRFVDDPDTIDTGIGPAPIVDMGAYEFQPASCPADVNGDGQLNVLDFVAFQLLWQAADPAADCDANAEFDVLDFVCYQLAFQAGCP